MTVPDEIVLIADQRVVSIPIVENGEALIDVKFSGGIGFDPNPPTEGNACYTKVRTTVLEKLKYAQTLLPNGLGLCLYEGWRSLSQQKKEFDQIYESVNSRHPDWTHEEKFVETTKLVSPVVLLNGQPNVPVHSTGAAVDVYLIDSTGTPLEMGILVRDWATDSDGRSFTSSLAISPEARKHRKLMSEALSQSGLVNYPTEYWHWSYGDRYWAYMTRKPAAIYGSVDSTANARL